MNESNKLDNKKKIILIVSIVILIILGIVSATVAYFAWVGEESSISVTVVGEGSCSLKEDNDIFIEPTETRDGGRIIKFTAKQGLTTEAYISWTMTVNEINGLKDATFKYEMINSTTGASYGSGNFADITDGSTIQFSNDNETLALNTTYEFTLYLWIDGTIGNNPLSMADQTFDFDMNCTIFDGQGSSSGGNTLIEHITNLYTENYDSSKNVAFEDGTGMNYYAPSVRLMNDGLDSSGNMTNDPYTGNIRYYGADDSNLKNYIYFNCSDYSSQSDSTCETWRIIGIVDGKVKIIRSSSIGDYAYDDNSNDWNTSTLKNMLNEGGTYYNELKTKNSKTLQLISESTWYINGMVDPEIYSNASYKGERTGNSTWPGSIALAYPSDYGYAADLNECSRDLLWYDEEECTSVNWLTTMYTLEYYYWLITPDSAASGFAWFVSHGYVTFDYTVSLPCGVLPVLYLDSELGIESEGDGSSGNPYRISVS